MAVPPTQSSDGVSAGTMIDERYRIISELGRGAMGTVYLAEHVDIQKSVALKILHKDLSRRAHIRERFLREARSAARLDHPTIVQVTDFGTVENGALYMVMERIQGRPLSQLKASEVPPRRAVSLVVRILDALAHAHARGVIHRDLKPDNIMLVQRDHGDEVKVLDFGLAVIRAGDSPRPLTGPGSVFGTPRYMSPEQASGEPVDARSDLYSVAVMLTEVLTGRVLFDGETASEVVAKQVSEDPVVRLPPCEGYDSAALERVLQRALSKHPADRYRNAEAFRDAIERCAVDDLRHAEPETDRSSAADRRPPVTLASLIPRPRGRNRLILIAAAAAVVLASTLAILIGVSRRGTPDMATLEHAVASEDYDYASEVAHFLLGEQPDSARVYLLQGHVDFARDDRVAANVSYAKALELDPTLVKDGRFELNIRRMVEYGGAEARGFLRLLRKHAGLDALALFHHATKKGQTFRMRRAAYEILEEFRDFGDIDRLAWLDGELSKNSTKACSIRKWYVSRLIELEDSRTRPILERELGPSGKTKRKYACTRDMIVNALAELGPSG